MDGPKKYSSWVSALSMRCVRQPVPRSHDCLVGLSDGISKLAAHALLEPVARRIFAWCATRGSLMNCCPSWHCTSWMWCWPGRLRPQSNQRLSSERIARSALQWYGPASLVKKSVRDRFP